MIGVSHHSVAFTCSSLSLLPYKGLTWASTPIRHPPCPRSRPPRRDARPIFPDILCDVILAHVPLRSRLGALPPTRSVVPAPVSRCSTHPAPRDARRDKCSQSTNFSMNDATTPSRCLPFVPPPRRHPSPAADDRRPPSGNACQTSTTARAPSSSSP
jgi:hypothetical protein